MWVPEIREPNAVLIWHMDAESLSWLIEALPHSNTMTERLAAMLPAAKDSLWDRVVDGEWGRYEP